MPHYDIDSLQPTGSHEPEPVDNWSIKIGQLAGVRFYLSYTVFIAIAILTAFVAMMQNGYASGDVPVLAVTSVSIWVTGWVVQSMVQLLLHFRGGIASDTITIGVFGVELNNPMRRRSVWTARATLVSTLCTLTVLTLFGFACMAVHLVSISADLASWPAWRDAMAQPGFSLGSMNHIYVTAAWLFWIQAACQAYPMPPNLGRGSLAAIISLFAAEANEHLQTKLLRKSIQLIAIVTFVLAIASMLPDDDQVLPKWTVLFLLSVIIWVSSNHRDLGDWITALNYAEANQATLHQEASESPEPSNEVDSAVAKSRWFVGWVDSVRMRKKRKLAKEALRKEREEASDAARLDFVLKKVAEHGTDGLSDEETALLKRVSENLRRQRELES